MELSYTSIIPYFVVMIAVVLLSAVLVKIIPFTTENTNLKQKKEDDIVNIEFDILAKYANKK